MHIFNDCSQNQVLFRFYFYSTLKTPEDTLQKGEWLLKKGEDEELTPSDASSSKSEFRGTVTCLVKFFESSVRRKSL